MHLQILTLTALVGISAAFEITWSRYKDARSITVNETSYSVTGTLEYPFTNVWDGVSVFGRYVVAYTDSIVNIANFQTMEDYERNLIVRAYERSNGDDACGPGTKLSEPERYVFDGNKVKFSSGVNFITYDINGYSVFMLDESKYSVSGPRLPEDVERVFVDDGMLVIVQKDGKTIMRSMATLHARIDQEELLEEIRHSIGPIEGSRRIINSFGKLTQMENNLTLEMLKFVNQLDCDDVYHFEKMWYEMDKLMNWD